VQFSKIRLTGFKSFVDPTDLMIEPGLTGIVGPNGCGKSNLVEALRWAMGETSAKRLRGGEMDDVIFGGTSARPARNVAEVTLHLENSRHDAPAHYNEYDEIEVTRRIDRGTGSGYRINGREVRARDVQLLFADAASGAHSTALVSQGRIGAIINAKPIERRGLLEEAAGIAGLHSRRHEAELRLNGAEANLARLDDVLVTLQTQLDALKKQARQAQRYRRLSDHIRRAEAVVLHLAWRAASAALTAAAEQLHAAERAVADHTAAALTAEREREAASAALPALRQAEAAASAELQRLVLARQALDEEERRVAAARDAASQRLTQLAADLAREEELAADARAALQRLEEERAAITAAQAQEGAAQQGASAALAVAMAEVSALEAELTRLTEQVAAEEAQRASLQRQLHEAHERLARLAQRRDEIERQRAALAA
jgi:chromosome segregation protein